MPDHLHPARAEYLRVGTPVESADGLMVGAYCDYRDHWHRFWDLGGAIYRVRNADDLALNLRDPTARAHAVMAWTVANERGGGVALALRSERTGMGEADTHRRILMRMRALDETVTPAEAKAALVWAEGVRCGE